MNNIAINVVTFLYVNQFLMYCNNPFQILADFLALPYRILLMVYYVMHLYNNGWFTQSNSLILFAIYSLRVIFYLVYGHIGTSIIKHTSFQPSIESTLYMSLQICIIFILPQLISRHTFLAIIDNPHIFYFKILVGHPMISTHLRCSS